MFEITIISAENLEDVRSLRRMKVYARVSIGGYEKWTQAADKHNETNPSWNCTMSFPISKWMVEDYNTMFVVKLYCKRSLRSDKYVGEVHTPMKALFDMARATGGISMVSFPVQNGGANSQGVLRFSYAFVKTFIIDYKQHLFG